MSRTPVIVAVLAALALVLAGAWWIGAAREDAIDPLAAIEPVAVAPEPVALAVADAPLADAVVDVAPRVALAETPPVDAAPADASGKRAGAVVVRGTLVDARTGEPLPKYPFELADPGEQNLIVTDADGAFVSTESLLPGPLRARFFEARDLGYVEVGDLRVGPDGAALPLELRVASGPTFRIAISPADAPPLAQHAITLVLDEGGVRVRGRRLEDDLERVRFAPLPPDAERARPAQIVLESIDGVWRGTAKVVTGLGLQARTVDVFLRSFAALEVHVVDPAGAPLANALVTWTVPGGGNPREQTTREKGIAVFERIGADAGTLGVGLVRWNASETPLVLEQGVRRVETVALSRSPSAGSIRGTVVSDSGAYDRDVRMRLVPLDLGRGVRGLDARVDWSSKSGALVGRFGFDDLPQGRFRLEVVESDFFGWKPRRQELEAPREDLVVVVEDAVAVADLAFEPRDEDGSALAGPFEVRIAGAGEARVYAGRAGSLVVPRFPVDAPLRWRIDAAGRATAFGAWNDLAPLPSVAGVERRGAAPVLPRGWAQMYRVVRSNDRKPVAGVLAVVDGRESGRTDAQGRIELRAEARPEKVALRFKDWRTIDRVDLSPPRAGSTEFERTVRIEPPQKPKK